MKRGILFGLFVVILFISGCTEYPGQDPRYSTPKMEIQGGEVDISSLERPDIILLNCLKDCSRTYGGCIQGCVGLPDFEYAQCVTNCHMDSNFCIGHCVVERRSEISSP